MQPSPHAPIEVARGLLLLGVFHVHAAYTLMEHFSDPHSIRMAALQVKALTVHVTLFFALAGMTSHALADKTLASVLSRSAMLLAVAALAHVVGVLITYVLWRPWNSLYDFARDIGKPLVYGTEHASFSWFFIVLAVVRLLAFAWLRHRIMFFGALALAAMAAAAPVRLPDNIYERATGLLPSCCSCSAHGSPRAGAYPTGPASRAPPWDWRCLW